MRSRCQAVIQANGGHTRFKSNELFVGTIEFITGVMKEMQVIKLQ